MSEQEVPWTVGLVAETVSGQVVLKMTETQAREVVQSLTWLLADDEEDDL